ncbi:MAG: cell division protein FtsQ/DivIB [Gammaproteobacteria bacterium]
MQGSRVIAVTLVCAGLAWAVWEQAKSYETDAAPIKYVRTEGVFEYISKEEVKKTLQPLVDTGFFSADMQAIKQAVLQLPWVEKVSVKRVWPDAIDIKVYEQTAYVRWGQNSLLNERGEKFTPANAGAFEYLPLLNGPAGQEQKVLELMKGISTTLADQAMELVEFSINDRRAWRIVLANGMEILLGRKDQLRHFQRFLKALALFDQEQINAIATVDLRYPNGFAIAWKPDATAIDWKKIAEGFQQS